MFPQHKLFSVGLFVLFTSTHLGCAGQDVRNLFSRNDTAGYKTLEELEAQEHALAKAEGRSEEDKKPSVTARLASWSPFGKSESTDEKSDAVSKASDSRQAEESSRSQRFLGLPLRGREAIEPDPFLGSDSRLADREESPATRHKTEQKQSAVDHKPGTETDASSIASGKKSAAKRKAVADAAQMKPEQEEETKATVAAAQDPKAKSKSVLAEDEELAARFEQHFLLNSVGTVSRTESDVVARGNEMQEKVESKKSKATVKQLDIANNADRQIDQIDQILAADRAPRKSRASTVRNSPKATQGNSLAAFDHLLGTEVETKPDAAKRVTSNVDASKSKQARAEVLEADVNVANAETLFGAAAARQQARAERLAQLAESGTGSPYVERTGAWSKTPDKAANLSWDEEDQAKSQSNSVNRREDPFVASGDRDQIRTRPGEIRRDERSFGAPPVAAGDVDDAESAVVTAHSQFRNEFASSAAARRVVTANYGNSGAAPVVRPISAELSAANDTLLTSAPMAPDSRSISENGTPATGTRTGLIQSLSGRNWLLLIGGIIIIALLFAPSRTKPLTMNG
ncbi:MAG TPA: hypothetical protein PLR25_04395 [Planctomycetaceae bacterium]|mgnify:CR=1 FL=1|nr:hypothetical protein [Planctomycetaceae bacterium]